MKILICDPIEPSVALKLRAAGLVVHDRSKDMNPDELLRIVARYQAIVVRSRTQVTAAVLEAATDLRLVVRGGVGLDNIDVVHAQAKGVEVRNTPKASSNAVAELALGYMLALARGILQASASLAASEWKKKQLKGTELAGKTLGLIGYGHIGQALASKASALGMDVIFYDPCPPADAGHARLVGFEELLAQSDFVSLHVPLCEGTRGMLEAAAFAQMERCPYLINCARGGVVDEGALYDALVAGRVAGAALDVWAQEPGGNRRLLELKDQDGFNLVIGSPHIGANTGEGQARVAAEVVEILIEFSATL